MSAIQKEMEAVQAYVELLKQAEEVKKLYIEANIELPPRVGQLLSEISPPDSTQKTDASSDGSMKNNIEHSHNGKEGWISIPAREAYGATLVRAILEKNGTNPVRPRDLVDEVAKLNPSVSTGGVYNAGPRMDEAGELERTDDGWKLLEPQGFPVIQKDRISGPLEAFQKQEIAYYRRQLVIEVLREFEHGLQQMQVVDRLHKNKECLAPVSKDIVKEDLKWLLEQDLVKRVGNSKKYVLTEKGEQEE